jgi:hypothetical protein
MITSIIITTIGVSVGKIRKKKNVLVIKLKTIMIIRLLLTKVYGP